MDIMTVQEGIEYFQEEFLTNRFHVTHFGGCVILFNKDSFFSWHQGLPAGRRHGRRIWMGVAGSYNETCFQDPQSCAWLVVRSNLYSNIHIKYIDTKKTTCRHSNQRKFSHVTNGIICCACSKSAISVLQFVLKPRQKDYNTIQEKNESQRNRDQWWALLQGCHRTYHPRLQQARGREAMEIKILGVLQLRERSERSNPLSAATKRPHLTIIMNNLLKALSQHSTHSGMIIKVGRSSQEWKTDTSMCERPGRPDVTSWGAIRETQPGFSHEET